VHSPPFGSGSNPQACCNIGGDGGQTVVTMGNFSKAILISTSYSKTSFSDHLIMEKKLPLCLAKLEVDMSVVEGCEWAV
jgi:hypothetical protein